MPRRVLALQRRPRLSLRGRRRRGSAMLVCMLAAGVIALSATAILRAQQRSALRTRAVVQTAADQQVTAGLAHCAIARLRTDPAFTGTVSDADFGNQVRATLTPATPPEVLISVWLHPTAVQPAYTVQVDPTKL